MQDKEFTDHAIYGKNKQNRGVFENPSQLVPRHYVTVRSINLDFLFKIKGVFNRSVAGFGKLVVEINIGLVDSGGVHTLTNPIVCGKVSPLLICRKLGAQGKWGGKNLNPSKNGLSNQ